MSKKTVLILGKLPPPFMGPSIATQILLNSNLKNEFNLLHLDTKINKTLSSLGKLNLKKLVKNSSIYFKLLGLLIKHKPDVVLIPISQTTMGFIKDSIFILLSSIFCKKNIIQLRGSDLNNWLSRSSVVIRIYFKLILKCTNGVIVLGNNLKYLFKDYFTDEQIFVIPNGGNYLFPSKSKIKNDSINILYFSNLLESKGVEDVFKAVSIMRKDATMKQSYTIDFVGEWYKQDVKERCLKLLNDEKLPITIHSPKSGKDKLDFFEKADVFVFPPREPEGHPWAIVEAMAAALPIISTDKGAIIESVINKQNGYIVDACKPELIAEKLKLLIENTELREQMGKESYQLYLANFTEEKMVNKYTVVFNTVINYAN